MIKIISDSTCDLSPELIARYDIGILPLHIILGEQDYLDGQGINVPLRAGDFMITLPDDAHMPCVKYGDESVLCAKLIAKVKL